MATVNSAAIAATMSIRFENEIADQINRACVLLQLLDSGPGITGQDINWATSFGTAVGAARGEGASVVTYNNDDKVRANLDYGNYDDAFKITGKALRKALAAGNPQQLAMLFRENLMDSVERLAKGIQQDLWTGSGATNFIHGLVAANGPLRATGTYATIDRSTYPQWASNEYLNGGLARSLHKDLMRRVGRGIYESSGGKFDLIVCSPAMHQAYGETFNQERRYITEISLRGQTIKLDGGFNALEFDGKPVIEDVDAPDELVFLNTRGIRVEQLPADEPGVPALSRQALQGTPEYQYGRRASGLTAEINPLSRDGHFYPFQVICYPQLKVKRPNENARLGDLRAPA